MTLTRIMNLRVIIFVIYQSLYLPKFSKFNLSKITKIQLVIMLKTRVIDDSSHHLMTLVSDFLFVNPHSESRVMSPDSYHPYCICVLMTTFE